MTTTNVWRVTFRRAAPTRKSMDVLASSIIQAAKKALEAANAGSYDPDTSQFTESHIIRIELISEAH